MQEPIDDEMLWGEPNKTVSGDNPGAMTQEEIDQEIIDSLLAMMLWAEG